MRRAKNRDECFQKVMSKCQYNDNWCLIWEWLKNCRGYWITIIWRKNWFVHRFIYDYLRWISEWMTIDHMCRNPSCCNIGHLQELSHYENSCQWWETSRIRQTKYICEKHNIHRRRFPCWKMTCDMCHAERCKRNSKKYRLKKKEEKRIQKLMKNC
jgi:hypothetical protein